MPLTIIRNDITKMRVDAIVNAANNSLLGGGGVDGAIHSAAGPELLNECRTLGGCETGKAKLTGAYRLPCRYVIHTVGPIWNGGGHGERELLISCYTESLRIAEEHNCGSVAFPLISAGAYGYPKYQALRVAVDTIGGFLTHSDMTVYLVVYDKSAYSIGAKLFSDIASYIDDRYIDAHPDKRRSQLLGSFGDASVFSAASQKTAYPTASANASIRKSDLAKDAAKRISLDDALKRLDEGFTETLLRKIDERGMTDAECYKKANIDRKLFSKIRGDVHYRPSKQTALAFAIALELSIDETKDLLRRAGFALSHSSKFDIIIEYFIESGNYNIFEINEALFAFDQSLLGA